MKNNLLIAGLVLVVVVATGAYFLNNTQQQELNMQENGENMVEDEGAMMEEGDEMMEEGDSMMVPAEGHEGVDEMVVEGDSMMEDEGSMMEEGEVKTFNVTGSNFEFSTEEIRVNEGDTVRIVFNVAEGFHDWRVDEFSASTEVLSSGGQETIEFVADSAGTYEYYCSVGNHREMGMVGTLIVQ
ncbi:MAG: plastocyanin/azurin family copper-binding protein [Candidatus Spechtbacterales bacterium]|nr:plastocyanin/azurin family copper-binding protein [Candidatus Spechtbacterales bacterium]